MIVLPTFGRSLRRHFGFKVRKIPLSIPSFSCPNIDGRFGRGGCSYCINESFSPNFAKTPRSVTLETQIDALQSQFLSGVETFKTLGFKRFLAYFQSFSNTYAPIETLRVLHSAALRQKECVGISVGTRADCIDLSTLTYLDELNKKTYLWLEIGAQSSHNETLESINRQERFETVSETIIKLKELGIRVCVHLIFGLPNETDDMILTTVDRVSKLGVDAVKIHPLYIVKNAAIAKDNFEPLSIERYLDLLVKSIKRFPKNIVYQRISAGVDSDALIAPLWCKNKNSAMALIRNRLLREGFIY